MIELAGVVAFFLMEYGLHTLATIVVATAVWFSITIRKLLGE